MPITQHRVDSPARILASYAAALVLVGAALAAQALRLPTGTPGVFGSPYLSVTDLMKRWAVDQNRREVLMITDGSGRGSRHSGWHRGYRTDSDASTAATVAQKTGTNIFSIYAPSRGPRRYWDALNGQMNLSSLAEKTGGASFYLGTHSAVSFQIYLQEFQRILNNQYLLSLNASPAKRSSLQSIQVSTEVAGVEFATHDAVWVPVQK